MSESLLGRQCPIQKRSVCGTKKNNQKQKGSENDQFSKLIISKNHIRYLGDYMERIPESVKLRH